jgi:hypothetical protein
MVHTMAQSNLPQPTSPQDLAKGKEFHLMFQSHVEDADTYMHRQTQQALTALERV